MLAHLMRLVPYRLSTVQIVSRTPKIGLRVRAKIGKHRGIEAVVVKTSVNMVYLDRTYGIVNGTSRRNKRMKLPVDAFWRRYEPLRLA